MNPLDQLTELEAAASLGPWNALTVLDCDEFSIVVNDELDVVQEVDKYADGEFIAAARNAMPLLLEVVQAAQTVIANDLITPEYLETLRSLTHDEIKHQAADTAYERAKAMADLA